MDKIIERYKPELVKILFVGEAPGAVAPGAAAPGAAAPVPAKNKHFYLANTNLYRTINTAFEQVFGKFNSAEEFLGFFQSMGFYLDHLSRTAIDKTDAAHRKAARQNAVFSLSERLKIYQPEVVIILMKDIQKQVAEAVEISGISSVRLITAVPYPAGSDTNKRNCIAAIVSLLKNEEVD